MGSASRDRTDVLRSAGGLLLAAGAVTLFARKGAGEVWGDFALLLVLLLPAAVLYGLAISGADRAADWRPESWRSVLLVAGLLLALAASMQFLQVVGVDTKEALWFAGAFALTALLAVQGKHPTTSLAGWPLALLLLGLFGLVASTRRSRPTA